MNRSSFSSVDVFADNVVGAIAFGESLSSATLLLLLLKGCGVGGGVVALLGVSTALSIFKFAGYEKSIYN